ncbi:MAG: O-antigen ligase family protein [Bacillota bacterium]
MSTSKTIRKNKLEKAPFNSVIFFFLCIILFYPPFFRGLFFEKELLPTHIVSFSLFFLLVITKIRDKDFSLINSWPDFLGLGLVLLYFASIFYGVNKKLAIGEFLKYANYYAIYLMIKYLIKDNDKRLRIIVNTLLISGLGVSIIGIGSAIGTFSFNGAFVSGRINSTLQYPNALAAYLFALFILALGMMTISKNSKEKYFYILCTNIFFFTFIPTFSRGMWLMAPFILLSFMIFSPLNRKFDIFMNSLTSCIPSLILSFLFIQRIEGGNAFLHWSIFLLSVFSSAGLVLLKDKFLSKDIHVYGKRIIIVLISIAIIFSLALVIVLSTTEPLTLSNMNAAEDINKIVTRNVTGVLENHEYNLQADVMSSNDEQKPFSGQIGIYSIDEQGKTELLHTENINEDGKLSIDFSTTENTKSLNFRFINKYTNTEITFDNVVLYDKQTNEEIRTLKLKYKYLPESIVTRIESISATDYSAMSRITFYKDAFKIIKDYPIFGTGGGGWSTLYFTYQSYMYWTTQAHNYFMQVWIEVGTTGLAVFFSFIVFLIYSGYKRLRIAEDNENKVLALSIYTAWFTLLAHSMVDFDLSLGAVSILLWTLFGMSCHDNVQIKINDNYKNVQKYFIVVISLLLVIGSFSLNEGLISAEKAVIAANNKQYEQALKHFENANRYDPYAATTAIDLATLYTSLSEQNPDYKSKAIEKVEKALELEPYNVKMLSKAGQLYASLGYYEKALNSIDQSMKVQPMNVENYANQTEFYIIMVKHLMEKKDNDSIKSLIGRIPAMKESLIHASKQSARPFDYNKKLDLNMQKLNYLTDNQNSLMKQRDIDKVVLYNKFDIDLDGNGIPDSVRISNPEGANASVKMLEEGIELSNNGSNYSVLWIDNIGLKQNASYEMTIEYSSTLQDKNFDLYLYDYSNKSKLIGSLENIEYSTQIQKTVLTFDVTEPVTSGKQRIGIIHQGSDDGSIILKMIDMIEK